MRKSGRSSYLARYLLLDTSIEPRLASDPCPRYTYPCAGLRGVGMRRSHPRARRPARPAHRPCPARDMRPPPRVPALHGITLWKPKAAQPLSSQRPERARTAHRTPARCVPPAHLSMPPCTSCGPILLLLAVLPALPREASPRPHTSAASHSACAAACPARSSSYCHPPPDPCRTLGQPLCARCGGDPLDLVAFGLLPGAA